MNRAKAELAVAGIKRYFSEKFGEDMDFFLADHNHEELSPGSWSVAYEGWDSDAPWTSIVSMKVFEADCPDYLKVPGVFMEPIASWCLGLFDE